jgi:hypothetical protein
MAAGISASGWADEERDMMRMVRLGVLLLCAAILVQEAAAQSKGPQRKQAAPSGPPGDRRDQVVAAPGTPFHGKSYWLSMAQCGGAYFRLGNFYAEEATRTRAAKPDPAAAAEFNRKAESAGRAAAVFFDLSERFLMTDRGLSQEDAVQTYDAQVVPASDKNKKPEDIAKDALKASEPCPALQEACRTSVPKICSDKSALTQ